MNKVFAVLLSMLAFQVAQLSPAIAQQDGYAVGEEIRKSEKTKGFDPKYPELDWDTLIPEHWNPMLAFEGLNLEDMGDEDPKAMEALDRMKQAWDQAPVESSLNNKLVRIPGFAVPLDGSSKETKEFLLVPYFGACIHTPPPPANQIIHIKMNKSVPAIGAMQPYWVWGQLKVTRTESDLGNAGYRIEAVGLKPYEM